MSCPCSCRKTTPSSVYGSHPLLLTQGHQSLSSLSIFSSLLGYSCRHTNISHSKQKRNKTCLTLSPRTVSTPFPYLPLRQHSLKYFSILHILHLRSSLETTPFRLLSLPLFRGTYQSHQRPLCYQIQWPISQFTCFFTQQEHLIQLSLFERFYSLLAFMVFFSFVCLPTSWGSSSISFEGSFQLHDH